MQFARREEMTTQRSNETGVRVLVLVLVRYDLSPNDGEEKI